MDIVDIKTKEIEIDDDMLCHLAVRYHHGYRLEFEIYPISECREFVCEPQMIQINSV